MNNFLLFIFALAFSICRLSAATYYIDFNAANDSANGTSKATPWKHHPYMSGWSGSYTHAAGDNYIFKGGVTWDQTCFTMTLAGSGSSGAGSDYYGVDQTWFTGGSWTRPVWDRAYTSASTDLLNLGSTSYITIDNIEIKRLNTSVTDGVGLINSGGSGGDHTTIKNCYIHGWRTSSSSDGAHGGIIGRTFSTSPTWVVDNTEIENSENAAVQKNGICVRCVAVFQNGCKVHDNSSAILFCLDFNGCELYNISGDGFDGVYHLNGIYLDPVSMDQTVGYIRNSKLHDIAGGANMAYVNIRGGASVYCYNLLLSGTMSDQCAVEVEPFEYGTEGPGSAYFWNITNPNYDVSKPFINVVRRPVSIASGNNFIIGHHYRITVVGSTNFTGFGASSNTVGVSFVASATTITGTGEAITPITELEARNNYVINASSLTNSNSDCAVTYTFDHNLSHTTSQATTAGSTSGNAWAPFSGSSPLVGAGVVDARTGSTKDFAGNNWLNPPSIGYLEWITAGSPAIPTNYRKPRTLAGAGL